MKNLAKLTHAAQPKGADRRKAPRCQEPGCRRACDLKGNGEHTAHCYKHRTHEEDLEYWGSWNL